ncbi:MAG: type I DNA topoisomerase [Bacteroidota bacterium]|jgi:DNA topoisomerase-1
MAKNLVIVESPAKAKTIEGYLGKDFTVKASMGHIRDLAKGNDAIDVHNNFLPHYIVSEGKEQVVQELKKLVKQSDIIWLATDEDREGEAIAWHLYEELNLSNKITKRFVYHEVTKNAILKAIEKPREIDNNLVNAQQARRILDRLVGFELSPVLWRKVRPSLSAGRVQSVAVRLIVEREREIVDFSSSSAFKISGLFLPEQDNAKSFIAELPKRLETQQQAESFLVSCKNANFTVHSIETKPGKKSPAPPFTTSTLQQEASRKLGLSIDRTMRIAQQLYEAGHITYMRTDSVNLSESAISLAMNEISNEFGDSYALARHYTNKSSNAQEAHEAIRPTDFHKHAIDSGKDEQRLYELIWKRAIASQMADAQLEKTTASILISTNNEFLVAMGEVIRFEGFLKVYTESHDDDQEQEDSKRLPAMNKGDILTNEYLQAIQRFQKPAPRYTEASLVKKLEELGIGRPSTYAPTISTIQKRDYVVKENRDGKKRDFTTLMLKENILSAEIKSENYGAEKSKLFPTDIGMVVNDFLVEHFGNIVDFNFTASVEEQFDEIARGECEWTSMLEGFYKPFHSEVEKALSGTSKRANTSRLLGVDPNSDLQVYATITRFGSAAQIGESGGDIPPKFASLKANQSISTITLEEALALFKLPRSLGLFEEMEIKVGIGKFGPYLVHNKVFTSIKPDDDPYTIELDRAIELIQIKRQDIASRLLKEFPSHPEIKVVNGRYGPYITIGKQNVKMPKGTDPLSVSIEQALQWGAEQEKPNKTTNAKGKKVVSKRSTAKKAIKKS